MRSSKTDSSSNRRRAEALLRDAEGLRTELGIQSGRLDLLEAILRGFLLKKASPQEISVVLDKARSILRCELLVLHVRNLLASGENFFLCSPRSLKIPSEKKEPFLAEVRRRVLAPRRLRGSRNLAPGVKTRQYIAVSLENDRGFVLAVNKKSRPDFTPNDRKFLEAFAAQMVMIMKNLALYRQAQDRIRELSVLMKASELASSTLELNLLLYKLIAEAKNIIGAQAGSIILLDKVRQQMVFYITVSRKDTELKKIAMPVGQGIAGWVLRRRTPCIVNDTRKDKRFFSGVDRATQMRTKSVLAVPLIAGEEAIGVIELVNKTRGPFEDEDMRLLSAIASHSAMSIRNVRLFDRTQKLLLNTVSSLTQAIDAKDPYTAGHSDRVTYYCLLMARGLSLPRSEKDKLRLAALLHDVGKIGIREEILLKPGKLTEEEFSVIRQHPVIGERILQHIEEIKDVLPGIRSHHERIDGAGYPDRARGQKIALISRIISVADSFDAMTSDRPYRKKFDYETAVAELFHCSGTQFDADLVRVFVRELRKEKLIRSTS